jgi:sugar lactone lactonase YvrE
MKTVAFFLLSIPALSQGIITTVAGAEYAFSGDRQPALTATMGEPRGVTVDASGNLYVADPDNSMVFRVDPGGILTIVAGTGRRGFSGDGGPAREANLDKPFGIVRDAEGNLYFVDTTDPAPRLPPTVPGLTGRIRRVSTGGIITTVAGDGDDFEGENIPANTAQLRSPTGLAIDAEGNLYVAEAGQFRVRRISKDGTIRTVAGTGKRPPLGFFPVNSEIPDGIQATETDLAPGGIGISNDGSLLIADSAFNLIRKVTPDGLIHTIAGGGQEDVNENTPARNLALLFPSGVIEAADGSIYYSDGWGITRIDAAGLANPVTRQTPNGPLDDGVAARHVSVRVAGDLGGLALDSSGRLYIADIGHKRIRRIEKDGTIATVAGSGDFRYAGDNGPATDSVLYLPTSVAVSPAGIIYFTDSLNCRVRRIVGGQVITVAGNGSCTATFNPSDTAVPWQATDRGLTILAPITVDGGENLFVAQGSQITKVNSRGSAIAVLAPAFPSQGPPPGPPLFINGLYAANGAVYFSDRTTHRLLKLDGNGVVTTIAGSGVAGFSGDGGPAIMARLFQPGAITGDPEGNLYFLDSGNSRVRRIGVDGTITTVAGDGNVRTLNLAATNFLVAPSLAFWNGSLYLTDPSGNTVRKIAPGGAISTIGGAGRPGFAGDGGDASSAVLNSPSGIGVDATGNLYLSDSGNNRVRKIQQP